MYDYTSHVRTEFKGTGQDSSNIYVTGTVKINFPTKCEGVLKLEDVELREWPLDAASAATAAHAFKLHEHSKSFAYDVQKHDLRYHLLLFLSCLRMKHQLSAIYWVQQINEIDSPPSPLKILFPRWCNR